MADTRTALFGISIGNSRFKRPLVSLALREGLLHYERIVFFIADRIQAYNILSHNVEDLALGFRSARIAGQKYLPERRTWLDRVRKQVGLATDHQEWLVIGVDQIADHSYLTVFRNILILYELDNRFRKDVLREVYIAESSRRTADPYGFDWKKWRRLSARYILEEISLNIYIRWRFSVSDEFYLGGYLPLVIDKMIDGRYKAGFAELLPVDMILRGQRVFLWKKGTWIDSSQLSRQDRLDMVNRS